MRFLAWQLKIPCTGAYTHLGYWGNMMALIPIDQIEKRLSTVQCAICKTNTFGIDRRTLQSDGECRGVCLKCRYSFPVYTDMEFYMRTQPDIPYRLKEISCQNCHHRGVSLDFRITMSVREAIYFVTCTACQTQFPERSSLEAFE
ncbi:MAG: hypothetical protein LZF62_430046 [Nitrospira sp.]|nr:MAG: hypothetical protein LZF62_430046 [Nitrospira sp.]